MPTIEDAAAAARTLRTDLDRPIVIGVSGYGGAGKSTSARRLAELLPDAYRLRGDDFLDPARSHVASDEWDGVERERLAQTVLVPFRAGEAAHFQRFDWDAGRLTEPEPLPAADYLIVDLVGLFHPDTLPLLDLTVWIDVDLETATRRGMQRDRDLGRSHDDLWTGAWVPTERVFAERFAPRERAHVLVANM